MSTARVAQLAAGELRDIDAVLGRFARTQKNHRHIVIISPAQFRVFVNIDFGQPRAVLLQEGSDLRLGLFAPDGSRGARVDRHVCAARLVAGGRLRCARKCPAHRQGAAILGREVA